MPRSALFQRFAWLATAILFVACASAPEPVATKKKKKRKSDRTALKKKKKKREQADQEAKDEQPDKPKKGSVVITDDDENEDSKEVAANKRKREQEEEAERKKEEEAEAEAAAEKKRKKEEAAEAAADKKRKKEEAAEEAAAEKKRKKEEAAEEAAAEKKRKQEEEAAAEEAAAEKKRKKEADESEEVASKPKRKKEVEAEEAAFDASAETDASEDKPKKTKKTKAEPAEVDMSGSDVIEMEGDEEPPPGERRVAAIAVPGVDSDEVEEVETAAPLPDGKTPRAINERPLTLGKDKISVHGGLRVGVVTLPNAAGMSVSSTTQSFALGGTYGVSDKLEVGGDYTIGLSPGTIKGPLTLHAAYRASAGAKLDLAIGTALSVDYYTITDPATMQSTTRTLASFGLGAWARYRLNRKLSLFTGLPALPDSTVTLSKTTIPLPPLPYHLAVGLNGGGAIAFDAPIGVGYQLTPKLYAFADVDLAHVRIRNTANRFLFKDFIPIQLGAFYALDKLDIGAQFSDDLKQGFDFLRFDIVARYSIK